MTLLVFRLGKPGESEPFNEGIRNAFGLGGAGEVADTTPLLGAGEHREFTLNVPPEKFYGEFAKIETTIANLAKSSKCILAIIIDSTPDLQNQSPTPNQLEDRLLKILTASPHYMVLNVFLQGPPENQTNQKTPYDATASLPYLRRFGLPDLDERDLRVPLLGLQVLHHAQALLAAANGFAGKVHLFFSHAKKDGVPIATAAGEWLKKRLKGFSTFYDTENLDVNGNIDAQLQSAIQTAVVIVFRTEVFDQRYWCQKEVLWAEKNGRPLLVVDARWQLQHSASVIMFDSVPAVRIPDGSFVRIFTVALHEAVRVDLFKLRVNIRAGTQGLKNRVASIPRFPSLVSLGNASQVLSGSSPKTSFIVYPNPSLPAMLGEVTAYFAEKSLAGCKVMSFDEFALLV